MIKWLTKLKRRASSCPLSPSRPPIRDTGHPIHCSNNNGHKLCRLSLSLSAGNSFCLWSRLFWWCRVAGTTTSMEVGRNVWRKVNVYCASETLLEAILLPLRLLLHFWSLKGNLSIFHTPSRPTFASTTSTRDLASNTEAPKVFEQKTTTKKSKRPRRTSGSSKCYVSRTINQLGVVSQTIPI